MKYILNNVASGFVAVWGVIYILWAANRVTDYFVDSLLFIVVDVALSLTVGVLLIAIVTREVPDFIYAALGLSEIVKIAWLLESNTVPWGGFVVQTNESLETIVVVASFAIATVLFARALENGTMISGSQLTRNDT